ncbi:MAG: Hsp20/alpha crystallin family protein [Candidatus Jordarchaeaceae archaeon]
MDWRKICGPGFPYWKPRFEHHFRMMTQNFPGWFDKIKQFISTYVAEDKDNVIVEIDMPGFEKDNIELRAGDYYLEVSAERQHSEDEIKLRGTEKKTFNTKVDLPAKVKADGAKATYKNGVLRVVLKKEPEKSVEVD